MKNKNDYSEAYKIYSKYNGNYFFMVHENEYEHYKSFKVPYDIEMKWEAQFLSTQLEKLDKSTNEPKGVELAFNIIDHLQYDKAILFLMKYVNSFNGDTFSKLLLCERLKAFYNKKKFIYNVSDSEWEGLLLFIDYHKKQMISNKITVDESYKMSPYLDGLLDENSIRERILRL